MPQCRLPVGGELQPPRPLRCRHGPGHRVRRYRTPGSHRSPGADGHVRPRELRASGSTDSIGDDTHTADGADLPQDHVLPAVLRPGHQ